MNGYSDKEQMADLLAKLQKNIQQARVALQPMLLEQAVKYLQQLEEQGREYLSAERYAWYAEIFQGVRQALQQELLSKDRKSLAEVCDLSRDLLELVQKKLEQEQEMAAASRKKKCIVFLPYKASMWDSLESIWKAAAEDRENCDAYVIPIPYCDRNPDGSAKEWHCEASLFPSDVPVLDYRQVDLAVMHPDVIYIHNPYDDTNLITSVDPAYYSPRLKACTDLLVYVPYFVLEGDSIAPNLCQSPGIVNADKVIVQSEKIKEQYEKFYPAGEAPKDKFLPLGSPKLDKVLQSKREDFALPEEWRSLLHGRKAVFFNISVTSLLRYRDIYVDYLQRVFAIFRSCSNIVLWWRPHPLLMATIDSMAPELAKIYKKLVEDYRSAGWGIYDDTADLHRAISWTDAYFGDPSSVIALYKETKKPVFQHSLNDTAKKNFEFGLLEFLLYNRLLQTDSCSYELPVEWETYLAGKKRVLYNLTQEALFAAPVQALQKLQRVIDAAKRRETMLLWWYASPALEAAIGRLPKKLQAVFEKIREESRMTDAVLYDNSGDICRAAFYTDAYYGDRDAVIWVFQYQNKPVQLQEVYSAEVSFAFLQQKSQPVYESTRIQEQMESLYPVFFPSDAQLQELTTMSLETLRKSSREQYPLPAEWQQKMEGKRIVFYHLGKNALNDGAEALKNRLHFILQIFANAGYLLWWYDDGAMREIIEQQHAEDTAMQAAYEAMEKECQESPVCIPDTTGNLPRAFAWSDTCYADQTELFWLYKVTGKPAMLQNPAEQKEADTTLDVWDFVSFLDVMDKKKEELPLPEKWQKLIQGKKVVLYHMTWRNAIAHLDKVNAKLRYVFAIFKEHPEIALWWKVDPIIERVMELMAPELAEEYREIVGAYVDEGWGVYDDLSTFDLGIVCSDAYYGDRCCMANVYKNQLQGRPVLWEDVNFLKEGDSFCFGNLILAEGSAWGISLAYPLLCEIDLTSHQVKEMLPLPGEPFVRDAVQYIAIGKMNQELVLIPYRNNRVLFFDVQKKKFRCLVVDISPAVLDPAEYCFDPCALWRDRYLLLFPTCKPVIIRCDLQTGECRYYRAWYDVIRDELPYPQAQIFGRIVQPRFGDDAILIACKQMNVVLELNLETEQVTLHRIGSEENHFLGIYRNEDKYWLTTVDKAAIISWDYRTGKYEEYTTFPNEFVYEKQNGMPFFSMTFYKNLVVVLPYAANMILLLDCKNGKMKGIATSYRYPDMIESESGQFIASRYADQGVQGVSFFDLQTNTIEDSAAYLDEEGVQAAVVAAWTHSDEKIWNEWELSCTMFIRNLAYFIKKCEKNAEHIKGLVGVKIYEVLYIER